MVKIRFLPLLPALCLLLAACVHESQNPLFKDPVAQNPDHRIMVVPASPGGKTLKALPPECPAWTKHRPAPLDNMPQPQIGCANQRNLALMIEQPEDLLPGPKKLGLADPTKAAESINRLREGKARGLYDPIQYPPPNQ